MRKRLAPPLALVTIPRRHALILAIVCFLLALLCFGVLFARGEETPKRKAFTTITAVYAGLAAIDLAQTVPCLDGARCRELGPLYRGGSVARVVVIKSAGTTAGILTAWRLRRQHPKLAWTLLGTATAAQSAALIASWRLRSTRH